MQTLMAADDIHAAVSKLSQWVISDPQFNQIEPTAIALVGIRRRGEIIAQRTAELLSRHFKRSIDVGALDITMYRDDVMGNRPITVPMGTEMNFRLDDRVVILLDDVLQTGRSVRAALDALVDFGRPRFIRLAVLVDRGGREYPIAADFVGRKVDADPQFQILVHLKPIDDEDGVYLELARQPQKTGAAQ
ncbi:MAG TPA: bifunctional pyr operon transcriptional regulator/uracil phosphoribosyltransferase PyrR [Phycisphaerae bacterium]|nr:bifunctional pyr operon transcriptional regulator/uracil phosphoribosyltransferase PyrR [Phycisphaerae bacterium]